MKPRELTITALTAALCCVLSPVAVPVGAVPVSLSLFAVYLAAALSGPMRGAAAVAIYIVLGAVGLPVFSGFSGGIGHILGATGGFIIGYIPCAVVTALFVREKNCAAWRYPVGMTLGTLCCYIFGTVWFSLTTGNTVIHALTVCVLPFVLFDAAKITAASLLCPRLRTALAKLSSKR